MPTPSRRTSSLRPALRRLADRVLETPDLEALARLLTQDLPRALRLREAALLVWDRKLERFQALRPGEARPLGAEAAPSPAPEARWLISEGVLLETPGRGGPGVLIPLNARTGLVGMLNLPATGGRRRVPFRPSEARLLWLLACRAALAVENHLYLAELLASERMAALGTMAGMLAHDFRGPMTVIRGYAETLLDGEARPEDVRARAALIVQMVDRLERMTGETLDFARGAGALVRRPLAIGELLEDLARSMEAELPGLAVVRAFAVPPEATIEVDADKLRRALGNMAANARDAMGGRGRLHLAAELSAPEGAEPRLVLVIQDEGPGVPPEIRERLFEPFVTRGKKGGTGLGLAVARRFIEEHGGSLELLESSRGARFRVGLPLREPVGAVIQSKPGPTSPRDRH